jgi:hypothetical protein
MTQPKAAWRMSGLMPLTRTMGLSVDRGTAARRESQQITPDAAAGRGNDDETLRYEQERHANAPFARRHVRLLTSDSPSLFRRTREDKMRQTANAAFLHGASQAIACICGGPHKLIWRVNILQAVISLRNDPPCFNKYPVMMKVSVKPEINCVKSA